MGRHESEGGRSSRSHPKGKKFEVKKTSKDYQNDKTDFFHSLDPL